MMRGPILPAAAALLAVPLVRRPPPAAASLALAPAERAAVTINVTDLLANEPRLPLPVRQRAEALVAYYQENGGPLLWVGRQRMEDLVARLRDAADDGLDPTSYPADKLAKLVDAAGHTDARSRAIIELYFSAAFLEYASDLRVGRLLPHKVDPNFFLQNRTIDQLDALEPARPARASIDAFFDAWQPQAAGLCGAQAGARPTTRAIAATGGWPSVPLGDSLKPGMTRRRACRLLRARLFLTDGAPQRSFRPGRALRPGPGQRGQVVPEAPRPRGRRLRRQEHGRRAQRAGRGPHRRDRRSPWSAGGGCRRTSAATT